MCSDMRHAALALLSILGSFLLLFLFVSLSYVFCTLAGVVYSYTLYMYIPKRPLQVLDDQSIGSRMSGMLVFQSSKACVRYGRSQIILYVEISNMLCQKIPQKGYVHTWICPLQLAEMHMANLGFY